MLRRYFLFHMLLGWLLSVGSKIGVSNLQNSSSTVTLNRVDIQNEPISIFVATNGDDRWSGSSATPTKDNRDGPFASLNRAQAAVRQILRDRGIEQPIKVIFGGGTYRLTESITFTTKDSGTKRFPITYTAAPQQQVTISGGKVITDWQEKQLNGLRLWVADLPAELSNKDFQHLWVNGNRRVRARYPSRGYLKIESVFNRRGQNWHEGDRSFSYKTEDLPQDLELQGS